MTNAERRAELVRLMDATARQEPYWHYAQTRPYPVWKPELSTPITTDCSGGVSLLAKWADCPDPNGRHFDGLGFTGTLLAHLPHIPSSFAQVGDLVVLGPGTGDHVVMLHGRGMCWTHGWEGGPLIEPLSRQVASHRSPVTYLRLLPSDPTPEDKLRARTGFFSWVAWYLGEGDWKKYGRRNFAVRPSVPPHISTAWWRALKVFLRARGS